MIKSLHITNYALIASIDIEFDSRLNIITGETGAGKSIILSALSLVMGGRADTRSIRDNNKKTVVEAQFDIKKQRDINEILAANDVDSDSDLCIIRREITSKGGSRAFINDTPVTLTLLKEVSNRLLDIHSQHENALLADNSYQLSLIDALAGNDVLLKEYRTLYADYKTALKDFVNTRDMLMRNRAEKDYLSFQLAQLDELALQPGEQTQLEHERDILANLTEIKSSVGDALDQLTSPTSMTASLSRCIEKLNNLTDVYDAAEQLAERLQTVKVEIQDITDSLDEYNNSLAADPGELDRIEDRLNDIYSLEAKHHIDNDAGLIELQKSLREKLSVISNADVTLADLENKAKRAKKAAVLKARQLSERRNECAGYFAAELKEQAIPLGLENLRCDIALTQGKLTAEGIDSIEFMFAFNKNQALTPIGKTASGGEISRIFLAVKSIVATRMDLPTMIFDEIDTGVSGDIANRMGQLMKQISDHSQVITITHLPTVAAHGDAHYKVYKHDEEDSTVTEIRLLSGADRISELAQMLSGSSTNVTALAAAESLLNNK